MCHFRVRINLQKGVYKTISVASDTVIPIKLVPFIIEESGNDIFLINLQYDQTLQIGDEEKHLLLKWKRYPPNRLEVQDNYQFIQILFDNDFVERFGGIKTVAVEENVQAQLAGKWFTWARIFLGPFIVIQLLLVVSAVVLIVRSGFTILPSFGDFFWYKDLFVLYIASYFIGLALTFVHECAHFLFAKAYGIESRINLFSSRLTQLVSETHHYYIYSLPKSCRIGIYLSGILIDASIAALCIIFLYFGWIDENWISFIRYLVLIEFLNIWWQFSLFYKTDIYNAISDWIGQQNLYEDSLRYLQLYLFRHRFPKTILETFIKLFQVDTYISRLSILGNEEKRNARAFAVLMVIGLIQSIVRTLFFSVPRDIVLIKWAFLSLAIYPPSIDTIKVLLVLVLICSDYIILLVLYARKLLQTEVR